MRSVDFAYRASVIVGEIALDSSYVTADVTNETSLCNWSNLLSLDLLFGAIGRSVLGSFSFDYVVIIGVGHGRAFTLEGVAESADHEYMSSAIDELDGLSNESSGEVALHDRYTIESVVTELGILIGVAA